MVDKQAKREAARRKRLLRKMARHERHQVWRCWWTWPIGHVYEEHRNGYAEPEWRCVGCGRQATAYDVGKEWSRT